MLFNFKTTTSPRQPVLPLYDVSNAPGVVWKLLEFVIPNTNTLLFEFTFIAKPDAPPKKVEKIKLDPLELSLTTKPSLILNVVLYDP